MLLVYHPPFQIKGYQGLVSCPDKRLCLYADVKPPSDHITAFPASITRQARLLTCPVICYNMLQIILNSLYAIFWSVILMGPRAQVTMEPQCAPVLWLYWSMRLLLCVSWLWSRLPSGNGSSVGSGSMRHPRSPMKFNKHVLLQHIGLFFKLIWSFASVVQNYNDCNTMTWHDMIFVHFLQRKLMYSWCSEIFPGPFNAISSSHQNNDIFCVDY